MPHMLSPTYHTWSSICPWPWPWMLPVTCSMYGTPEQLYHTQHCHMQYVLHPRTAVPYSTLPHELWNTPQNSCTKHHTPTKIMYCTQQQLYHTPHCTSVLHKKTHRLHNTTFSMYCPRSGKQLSLPYINVHASNRGWPERQQVLFLNYNILKHAPNSLYGIRQQLYHIPNCHME